MYWQLLNEAGHQHVRVHVHDSTSVCVEFSVIKKIFFKRKGEKEGRRNAINLKLLKQVWILGILKQVCHVYYGL